MTPKKESFCQEFCIDYNGTQAAIRAGYSKKTANEQAARLLTLPEIQQRIAELQKPKAEALQLTRERVLDQYARIGFFDIRTIYTDNNSLKPVHDWDDAAAAAVAGIEVYEEFEGKGEDRIHVGNTVKVKLKDSKGALDSICKVMGWNAPEKHEMTGKDGEPLMPKPDLSKLTKEELQQFIELSKKLGG